MGMDVMIGKMLVTRESYCLNNTLKEGNRMMMVRGGNAISDLTKKESFKCVQL